MHRCSSAAERTVCRHVRSGQARLWAVAEARRARASLHLWLGLVSVHVMLTLNTRGRDGDASSTLSTLRRDAMTRFEADGAELAPSAPARLRAPCVTNNFRRDDDFSLPQSPALARARICSRRFRRAADGANAPRYVNSTPATRKALATLSRNSLSDGRQPQNVASSAVREVLSEVEVRVVLL
jgi:hypothetical protein